VDCEWKKSIFDGSMIKKGKRHLGRLDDQKSKKEKGKSLSRNIGGKSKKLN